MFTSKFSPMLRDTVCTERGSGKLLSQLSTTHGVAISTLSVWCKGIKPESKEYPLHMQKGQFRGVRKPMKQAASLVHSNFQRRLALQQVGFAQAKARDILHIMGCMLYWAEGGKQSSALKFVNTDPDILRLFVTFLQQSLHVIPTRIKVTVRCWLDSQIADYPVIQDYWSKTLGIPMAQFGKPTTASRISTRAHRWPYGMCSITCSKSLPELQAIYGAIQAYGGFHRPAFAQAAHRPRATGRIDLV